VIETVDTALRHLVAQTRCLLVDFDGPICAVFGGQVSAELIARRLHALLPGPSGPAPADPFDVLRAAATLDPKLAARIEAAFARAEREAIKTAPATDHAEETINAARASRRRVAIVSNNSTGAVEDYLARQRLAVDLVIGRTSPDASLLKPSPHLVTEAIRRLQIDAGACTLIGDSVTDIIASQHAGVSTIGYANKPHKHEQLSDAGADVVLNKLAPLAAAFAPT